MDFKVTISLDPVALAALTTIADTLKAIAGNGSAPAPTPKAIEATASKPVEKKPEPKKPEPEAKKPEAPAVDKKEVEKRRDTVKAAAKAFVERNTVAGDVNSAKQSAVKIIKEIAGVPSMAEVDARHFDALIKKFEETSEETTTPTDDDLGL